MRTLKISAIMIFIFSLFCNYAIAQQDYKIVQDFKTQYQRIKEGINKADSLSELNQFETQINQLAAE